MTPTSSLRWIRLIKPGPVEAVFVTFVLATAADARQAAVSAGRLVVAGATRRRAWLAIWFGNSLPGLVWMTMGMALGAAISVSYVHWSGYDSVTADDLLPGIPMWVGAAAGGGFVAVIIVASGACAFRATADSWAVAREAGSSDSLRL